MGPHMAQVHKACSDSGNGALLVGQHRRIAGAVTDSHRAAFLTGRLARDRGGGGGNTAGASFCQDVLSSLLQRCRSPPWAQWPTVRPQLRGSLALPSRATSPRCCRDPESWLPCFPRRKCPHCLGLAAPCPAVLPSCWPAGPSHPDGVSRGGGGVRGVEHAWGSPPGESSPPSGVDCQPDPKGVLLGWGPGKEPTTLGLPE